MNICINRLNTHKKSAESHAKHGFNRQKLLIVNKLLTEFSLPSIIKNEYTTI